MKKIVVVSIAILALAFAFAGCGTKTESLATATNTSDNFSKKQPLTSNTAQTPEKPETKTTPPKSENPEKPKTGDVFDNASMSFSIPKGYTVIESYPYIELTMDSRLEKTVKFNVTPMVETVSQAVSDLMADKNGVVTDVKIGSYSYKKISINSSDIGLVNLVTTNGKSIVRISVLDLGDSQVMEVLNSLRIK